MNSVTATLPMSPAHGSKVGFYSIHALTHYCAQHAGAMPAYALNTQGKCFAPTAIPLLKDTAARLALIPAQWWHDTSITPARLQHTLESLYAEGHIRVRRREVRHCTCGTIELFAHVSPYSKKTMMRNGSSLCCNSTLRTTTRDVLVTRPMPPCTTPCVYPNWAAREYQTKHQLLVGSELLVSRYTPRPHSIVLAGSKWHIDTDVLWWLLGTWLDEDVGHLQELVVGTSTLRHAVVVSHMAALSSNAPPTRVYCVPKVFFQPIHGIETIEAAVARFGHHRVVHALLWCALSEQKRITLHGALFPTMHDGPLDLPFEILRPALRTP